MDKNTKIRIGMLVALDLVCESIIATLIVKEYRKSISN
ncbi:hypothetical protein EV211_10414 [Aminicella lysinilytica]|uniref:Uncharacterized protein n=1 Tax=Aminicella lysinilytica TaxID=433323 RepID=A0A4R6Q8Z8_9FIRM|nr:hypothetical protein EV211_10414 [Aminicella lysinilytica]